MRYRWLHISDLHSIYSGIETEMMKDTLINEIKFSNEQCKFSFIVITGDISDKNSGYSEAKEFIHRIVSSLNLPLSNVFIVPGNHDVNRKNPNDREEKAKKYCEITDVLKNQEKEAIDELLPGQDDFFYAYKEILGRDYPIDKVHFYEKLDENIAIIHMNTSWMCYDSENENGKLHIGFETLYGCLNDEELDEIPIKIAIGHHRLSDFNKKVSNSIKTLFQNKNIDIYLGGHCHEATIAYDYIIETEICSCRQARVENEKRYPAGFIIGDINTEDNQSSFRFYEWDKESVQWKYDYEMKTTKHGKYYMKNEKFTKKNVIKQDIIIDLKMFGIPLNYEIIAEEFNIKDYDVYDSSIRDINPKSKKEWNSYLKNLKNIYKSIIKKSNKNIHIFPIAPIPLLVSFGYFLQNDSSNIKIYQYFENKKKWVFDEKKGDIIVKSNLKENNSNKLALALSISGEVKENDIEEILSKDYDLLSVKIDNPKLSFLNYYDDVSKVKEKVKDELDSLIERYKEIHLFLAAPAGLCIEIGRIIRENMYPDTYIYNYNRTASKKYTKIFNLKDLNKY